MKPHLIPLGITCLAASLSPIVPADTPAYSPPAPTQVVTSAKLDWHDARRDRDVPVKIYFPKEGAGPFPIVIFSHGLGGSREGYEYLGRHWAGCGYVSVHMQHIGSDDRVWKDVPLAERAKALQRAAANIRERAEPAAGWTVRDWSDGEAERR